LSEYESASVGEIRASLSRLEIPSAQKDENAGRAATLMHVAINRALGAIGLRVVDEPPPGGEFWSAGAETIGFDWNGLVLRRRVVRTRGEEEPDERQRALLLEFTRELFLVADSMVKRRDELAEFADDRLLEQAISSYVGYRWHAYPEQSLLAFGFPGGDRFFSAVLLSAMKRLLVSTYEGEAANGEAVLVPPTLSPKLRSCEYVFPTTDLLGSKMFRKLSIPSELCFAFGQWGEFLGLHTRADLPHMLACPAENLVSWRTLTRGSLGLFEGERLTLLYRQGRWNYIDYDYLFSLIVKVEPSVRDANRAVWEAARNLSLAGRSAIFLLTPDPNALLAADACARADIDFGAADVGRAVAARPKGSYTKETTLAVPHANVSLREHLVEQFRGATVAQIGHARVERLAAVDGATIVDTTGHLRGFGVILRSPEFAKAQEGAGATAAKQASRFGLAIKVSADGPITVFHRGEQVGAS
jgi:hypothetical protein